MFRFGIQISRISRSPLDFNARERKNINHYLFESVQICAFWLQNSEFVTLKAPRSWRGPRLWPTSSYLPPPIATPIFFGWGRSSWCILREKRYNYSMNLANRRHIYIVMLSSENGPALEQVSKHLLVSPLSFWSIYTRKRGKPPVLPTRTPCMSPGEAAGWMVIDTCPPHLNQMAVLNGTKWWLSSLEARNFIGKDAPPICWERRPMEFLIVPRPGDLKLS